MAGSSVAGSNPNPINPNNNIDDRFDPSSRGPDGFPKGLELCQQNISSRPTTPPAVIAPADAANVFVTGKAPFVDGLPHMSLRPVPPVETAPGVVQPILVRESSAETPSRAGYVRAVVDRVARLLRLRRNPAADGSSVS